VYIAIVKTGIAIPFAFYIANCSPLAYYIELNWIY